MLFSDRSDAGRRLAARLMDYKAENPIVLGLPRGGVPVAAEIASALGAPLDIILVRKIGVPYQKELAMGAVVDGGHPTIVRNEDVIAAAGIADADFRSACDAELAEIERRRRAYVGGRKPAEVAGRTVIVVDDGLATGATMRAALRAVKMRKPKRLIMAVPVAPSDTLFEMAGEADDAVCLETPDFFGAIGVYYADFSQVADEEVVALLAKSAATPRATGSQPPPN